MKKIYSFLVLFILCNFIFTLECNADLTEYQAGEVAAFAENLILESANNHKDSNGLPLIAYSQGKRTEGMQEELAWFTKDTSNVNKINGYKWAFDCSSFASYVYYKTFGLQLFYNGSARPYTVSKFVDDALANKNFYNVMKNVRLTNIDYSQLKKGDLIIIVGSHIMVYIGDQKVAHVSVSAVAKGTNLGAEVVNVVNKYGDTKVNVIRVKNGLIAQDTKPNTTITWPDTKKTQDLGSKDDKPVITTSLEDTTTYVKKLNITLTDDKGIIAYTVTANNVTPSTWTVVNNQKKYTASKDITENGTYYIYAKDYKDQITTKTITITNIDKDGPIIKDIEYKYNQNGTFNINITAQDENKMTYSLDNITYQESNIFENLFKTTYTLYIKDIYNNVTNITIDLSDNALPIIITNYDSKYAKSVFLNITLSSKDGNLEYNISQTAEEPTTWNAYDKNFNYTITANGDYYIWVKNSSDISFFKKITINNIDLESPIISNVKILDETFTGYKLEVIATDYKSGIKGYSLDGIKYQESNIIEKVTSDNKIIYVIDNCDNIATYNLELQDNNTDIILIGLIIVVSIVLGYTIIKTVKKK